MNPSLGNSQIKEFNVEQFSVDHNPTGWFADIDTQKPSSSIDPNQGQKTPIIRKLSVDRIDMTPVHSFSSN